MPELEPGDARIADLQAKVTWLMERVAKLEAESADLRSRLQQNSQNSSLPPSSDPPGTPRSRRSRPGVPAAGSLATRRTSARLPAHRVVPLIPSHCGRCHRRLHGRDPAPEIHQVVALPEIRPDVTDYEEHELSCQHCGATTRASLPAGVPRGTFGPRLMAAVALCTSRFHMPKLMAQEFLRDVLGIEVGLGSIPKMEQTVSQALAAPVEEARAAVREQDVAHQDETGWLEGPEGGRKARAWLWVTVTSLITVYRIVRSRGSQVTKEMLGEDFRGFLVVGRWAAYRWVARGRRQLWVHLIRDFCCFAEGGGAGGEIGVKLLGQTEKIFGWWHRIRDGILTRRAFQRRMNRWRGRSVACSAGQRCARTPRSRPWRGRSCRTSRPSGRSSTPRCGAHQQQAERALRNAVIWRKISFGTDSDRGSRFVERILTVTATLKQQRRHVVGFLTAACEGSALDGRRPPSLLPAPA